MNNIEMENYIRELMCKGLYYTHITAAEREFFKMEFFDIVDSYLEARSKIDSEWINVPKTRDNKAEWDFSSDLVIVNWKEYNHYELMNEYFNRSFPLEHLWHLDWETLLKKEINLRIQEAEKLQAKLKAEKEIAERKLLLDLLNKHGVPEEFKEK